MKLLIVNGHLNIGGVEKSLVTFLNAIDYDKHSVDLLLFEGLGDYKDLIPPKVNIINYDLKDTYGSVLSVIRRGINQKKLSLIYIKLILTLANKVSLKALRLLKMLHIDSTDYDCAIAYRVGMSLDYVAYSVNAKMKMVWWHHGEFDYPVDTVKRWDKCFSRVDKIVCVSKSSRNMLSEHYSHYQNKMIVLPNMISEQEIIEKSKMSQNVISKDNSLISVGRFSEEKHMLDTIYAMKQLRELGYINVKWFLLGDGEERPLAEKLIQEYGLEKNVFLLGNVSNPYPYLKAADIMVHPSYVESQGISVLEAMVLHKKIVAVNSMGVSEFVVDGKNAWLCEKNIDALVKKIIQVWDLELDDNYISEQNRTISRYSPEQTMIEFESLL